MIEIQNPALKQIWQDRYQKNNETIRDNIYRVADHIATNDFELDEFCQVMLNGYFFPAGRTMSNAGIGKNLTLNNCFVYPIVEDSMEGIFEAVKSGALTHKAGGGIGYEFSLLRPNGSKTSNEAIASGVVSFMDVFNAQTATVMQGSRRGANMGVLSVYHPDIEEFIEAKSKDKNKLAHFNLSIMVDDKFMYAVNNNEKIYLHYPVYDDYYHIIEDKNQWKQFREIDANYLWNKIMQSAYDNGEPGIMFYDNMNRDNNTWYTETITHSNPCAEYLAGTVFGQELPSNQYAGACNLGSIMLQNLVRRPFTEHAYLDFSELSKTIRIAVKMLDNIIDINNFPLPQYENYQKNFRTIGLGVTGLADTLAMLNIKYNSPEAIEYVDNLMELIAIAAYRASIELAKERGSFPFLKADQFIQSGYLCRHRSGKNYEAWIEITNDILQYGIRNARLLSIAPTGTLSLTFGNNCSSGIEPIFSLGYDRKVKIGGQNEEDVQTIHIADYAYNMFINMQNNKQSTTSDKDVFVTAQEMTVNEHIDMLSAIAKHVDMSVSKTINVPTEYSFENTKDIYMRCWREGLKGCTIFRPNAIRQGILINNSNEKASTKIVESTKSFNLSRGDWKPKATDTTYYQRKLRIGCGKLFLFIGWSESEQCIQDFYVTRSGQGGCERLLQAAAISMSAIFRLGGNIDNIDKAFKGIGGCNSFATQRGKGEKLSSGGSCGVAILNELKSFIKEKTKNEIVSNDDAPNKKMTKPLIDSNTKMKCPECGKMSLRYEGGCNVCEECGYSSCG